MYKTQFVIDTTAEITKKNEVVSTNQLNHKAQEKYHDTEELVGCSVSNLNYVL